MEIIPFHKHSAVLLPIFPSFLLPIKSDAHSILLYLCVLVLPFLPASNMFVTVGFVVAERVLYIPSIGFCILVTFGLRKLKNTARFYWILQSCTIF
ncbi:transmembrane and TPR repeat-containing protein 1 [Caerostris extrusa]|uniref:Transmembrane and TPR repeat-containing protein 1 n=1 Tax=Caerostris extrusa TaxID=172846 RepID=A0AAV4M6C7_CAEEX|nr:transmembrane and TPR repeat-containing protein 1 [Caerostris extrusa]